jgi:hypothetical protein
MPEFITTRLSQQEMLKEEAKWCWAESWIHKGMKNVRNDHYMVNV